MKWQKRKHNRKSNSHIGSGRFTLWRAQQTLTNRSSKGVELQLNTVGYEGGQLRVKLFRTPKRYLNAFIILWQCTIRSLNRLLPKMRCGILMTWFSISKISTVIFDLLTLSFRISNWLPSPISVNNPETSNSSASSNEIGRPFETNVTSPVGEKVIKYSL